MKCSQIVAQCAKLKAITAVKTTLFSQFPQGFADLGVEWLAADSAGVVELQEDGAIKFGQ